MSDLGHLISQRVAATLDASFVEKEVESRIDEQVRDKYSCRHQLHIDKEGVIYSATIDNRDLRNSKQIGRSYGIGQKLRAYVACGTKIILDEDFVQRGIGDY